RCPARVVSRAEAFPRLRSPAPSGARLNPDFAVQPPSADRDGWLPGTAAPLPALCRHCAKPRPTENRTPAARTETSEWRLPGVEYLSPNYSCRSLAPARYTIPSSVTPANRRDSTEPLLPGMPDSPSHAVLRDLPSDPPRACAAESGDP